jgi:hypothetical protein
VGKTHTKTTYNKSFNTFIPPFLAYPIPYTKGKTIKHVQMDVEPLLALNFSLSLLFALNFLKLVGEIIHNWSKFFSKLMERNELTRMVEIYGKWSDCQIRVIYLTNPFIFMIFFHAKSS